MEGGWTLVQPVQGYVNVKLNVEHYSDSGWLNFEHVIQLLSFDWLERVTCALPIIVI